MLSRSLASLPARRLAPALLTAGLATLAGCASAPTRQVERVDPNVDVNVTERWNDTDARQTYQRLVEDALARPWIDAWVRESGGKRPVVIVGPVKNDTQEYIDTRLFTTSIERELINSGKVRFVAMKDQRGDVREERLQGQEWNTPATRKQVRAELGADFIVLGRVADLPQRALDGRGGVAYYKATIEVINLETNEKVWIGENEIKKVWRDR